MNCIIIPIQVYASQAYQDLLRSIEPENFYDLCDKLSSEDYESPIYQSINESWRNPPVNHHLAKISDLIAVYDYQTEKYLIIKDRYIGKCCWMNKADFIFTCSEEYLT